MRKFVLIAAMLLASASAQAGQTRGLTIASNDDQVPVAQSTSDEAAKPSDPLRPIETPKYAERAPLDTTPAPAAPKADKAMAKAKPIASIERKRRHESTEARVIGELHRYGIYW